MVRDLEKESKKILNGNRYIIDTDGKGVFSRDVDRLFVEYENLRNKLYNTYKHYLDDEDTKEELRSYIDEQFVNLVKEYEINSPVDFPGYIKMKLTTRVDRVFIKNRYKHKNREVVMATDWGVESQSDLQQAEEYVRGEEFEYVESLFGRNDMNDIQRTIVEAWLQQIKPQSRIVTLLTEEYGLTREQANAEVEELKEYFQYRLEPKHKKED